MSVGALLQECRLYSPCTENTFFEKCAQKYDNKLLTLCPLVACSMHYRMYVRGLSPYALIQNVTFFATDGPDQSGVPRLILTKAFGLPNGPANPTGGFGVPANGTTWVLTT